MINIVGPAEGTISPLATSNPGILSEQNFGNFNSANPRVATVPYTITAENGDAQVWTVIVTEVNLGSAENDIIELNFLNQQTNVVDPNNHTVDITVSAGTGLVRGPVSFVISDFASEEPPGLSQQNFNFPVFYTITAQNGAEQVWTVNVTELASTNNGPTAVDDSYDNVGAFTMNVLANDIDPDGDTLTLTNNFTQPSQGSVSRIMSGTSQVFRFTPPNSSFIGTTTFTYEISDGELTSSATVTIMIEVPCPNTCGPNQFQCGCDCQAQGTECN